MKKLGLVILVSLFLSGSGYAQCDAISTFPWTENFEGTDFPPQCWTSYDIDGGGSQWAGYDDDYLGSYAGHEYDCGDYQEGWLITPQLAIPNTGSFALVFKSVNNYPEDYEYNGVWVSTTGNDPISFLFTEIKSLSGDEVSGAWKKIIVPLTDYAGQEIYIGFKYAGYCADSWYISDVSVMDLSSYVDGEVAAVLSPVSGENLTPNEEVRVLLKNNGGVTLSNFTLDLEFNGKLIVSETFTDSIPSFGQAEYAFDATLDLSNMGGYEIKVTVDIPNDQEPNNNSLAKKIGNFSDESVKLYGFQTGFVSFESATPQTITQLNYGNDFLRAGEYVNGYFYGFSLNFDSWVTNFVKISTDTWTEVSSINANNEDIVDMAYDYSTNTMYGINYSDELVTIDMETGNTQNVSDFDRLMLSLACSTNGQLYGLDWDGNFCSINKTNASVTEIANIEQMDNMVVSMAFDHNTERLFLVLNNDQTTLFEINTVSGAVFDRGQIGYGYTITALFAKYATTGVIARTPANNVKIYPNPSNGTVNVEVAENSTVKVMDALGKVVDTYTVNAHSVLNFTQAAGMYFLQVESNGKTTTHKVTIR
ncbi:MAG: choice-of-anchor J domain-containing protein [Lentimicrobiaceae bacterium]|nr:choice-of-anchor J domain-containing protein [Lentimicrobiaceae bacterium]